jgi:hypothetical protein
MDGRRATGDGRRATGDGRRAILPPFPPYTAESLVRRFPGDDATHRRILALRAWLLDTVTPAKSAAANGLSRATLYRLRATWEQHGIVGLLSPVRVQAPCVDAQLARKLLKTLGRQTTFALGCLTEAQALADEFNCLSPHSDAEEEDCSELRFAKTDDHTLERQFKPPPLRNVAERAPYMHAGQFQTLRAVLEHYNRAPEAPGGHSELQPLHLSEQELAQLEAFLRSLSGPPSASTAPEWG